jgi:hypothetical protein
MRASLNSLEVDAMNWNVIYNIWKVDTKTKKKRPLVFIKRWNWMIDAL